MVNQTNEDDKENNAAENIAKHRIYFQNICFSYECTYIFSMVMFMNKIVVTGVTPTLNLHVFQETHTQYLENFSLGILLSQLLPEFSFEL